MTSSKPTTVHENQVLVEEKAFVRLLTLNRPDKLNVLSSKMISRLLELFLSYEVDPSVKLVIVKGKGRAFCAGGDVSNLFDDIIERSWKIAIYFSWKQLSLNYVMATYTKPQVSLLNGVVMGGGAGASIHGRFRVATQNTVFAMPETMLGLFPDVGASYYLSRLPGFFGEYLGLTGARLDGAEMLACGLATHFVASENLTYLEDALCKAETSQPCIISSVIDKFSQIPKLKEQSVYHSHRLDVINKCFSLKTVEEILAALEEDAMKTKDVWISATIRSLNKASPTSLKITLRLIREGRLQGIDQCLIREYRLLCHAQRGDVSRDFSEGYRALLLVKDKNPKWEPSKLELVTEAMVERYFSKMEDEDWEDLKLPLRTNLTPAPSAISKL